MKNILMAASEAFPFIKTGGLADVVGSLPKYLDKKYYDCRIVLPKYACMRQEMKDRMEYVTHFYMNYNGRDRYVGIMQAEYDGVQYYFIDNEEYFSGPSPYGDWLWDIEKFIFFDQAVLSILPVIGFRPDVIHCHDWQTGLIPVYIHDKFAGGDFYRGIKTVMTIHNLKFQGQFSDFVIDDICGLSGTPAENQLRIGQAANYMQGALKYVEKITTVSPSYADEICTKYFGEGLDWLFNERRDRLVGILNGIDDKTLDPENDKALAAPFNSENLDGKAKCKEALQKELGLEVNPNVPLFAIISRLTEQKGMDLVTYNLPMFADGKMQLVVLGTGDSQYEEAFAYYAEKYPRSIACALKFDEALSHRIYAGSDAFLMPSKFEPCGLSQLMAMRYGCLPIVRETGGLKDTVAPFNKYTKEGTGFSFANYNAHELKEQINKAYDLYTNDKKTWDSVVVQAMQKDYSWKQSAKEYRKLYSSLVK